MPEPCPDLFARNLRALNCTEVHYLTGDALGNAEFVLSDDFKALLRTAFDVPVPVDAFAAIGYQFQWLRAALEMTFEGTPDQVYRRPDDIIDTSCDSVSMLVAWAESEGAHVIMLEARGLSPPATRQFATKVEHMVRIFGEEGERWPEVTPHFAIVAPKKPARMNVRDLPRWALKDGLPVWLPLRARGPFRSVLRCDESGRPAADGRCWTPRRL